MTPTSYVSGDSSENGQTPWAHHSQHGRGVLQPVVHGSSNEVHQTGECQRAPGVWVPLQQCVSTCYDQGQINACVQLYWKPSLFNAVTKYQLWLQDTPAAALTSVSFTVVS